MESAPKPLARRAVLASRKRGDREAPAGYSGREDLVPLRRRRARLDDHERLGERRLVGDREMDEGFRSWREDRLQALGRTAGQPHGRLPRRQVDDPHVAPEDATLEARAERLGAGLLGGEPLGVRGGASGAGVGAAPLDFGEAALDEPLPVTLERLLDAANVAKVAADSDDHRSAAAVVRPSSIAARIRFTVSARPTKIASPTRKWPMLSSTISGRLAMTRAES